MRDARIALITGGTGYVGFCLAKRLISEHWEVHLIVRAESDLAALASFADQMILHIHDGSTDSMIHILNTVKPNVVFHLASLFLAQHAPKDVIPLIQSNIAFATQLVEAMAQNNVQNLINTGTSWQHYENKNYSPVCLYAATKQAFEALLQYYVEAKSIKAITLELFDTFGPHDPRPKLVHLLRRISQSGDTLAMSPGEQMVDIVYIDDVIDAYLLAAERLINSKGGMHERYAVSSGNPMSLKELVARFEMATGEKPPIQWGGRPYRDREVMFTWDRGNKLPGWNAKVSFEEGLRLIDKLNESPSSDAQRH